MYIFVYMEEYWDTLRAKVLVADVAGVSTKWGEGQAHCDPYGRLYWLQSGRASVMHHGRRWELQKNRLHVIPTNTSVWLHCPNRATIAYVHFTAALWGEMDLFEFLGGPYDLRPSRPGEIRNLMRRLRRAFQDSGSRNTLEVTGLLLQLLAPFQAGGDPSRRLQRLQAVQRFEPVFQYIETNLHRPIRLAELAQRVNLEPTYFSHVFARRFGVSPVRYVLRQRVERTRKMLWNTDATLESAARQLGFVDAFHLSRTFKRITGMSPRQFRQRSRRRVP